MIQSSSSPECDLVYPVVPSQSPLRLYLTETALTALNRPFAPFIHNKERSCTLQVIVARYSGYSQLWFAALTSMLVPRTVSEVKVHRGLPVA